MCARGWGCATTSSRLVRDSHDLHEERLLLHVEYRRRRLIHRVIVHLERCAKLKKKKEEKGKKRENVVVPRKHRTTIDVMDGWSDHVSYGVFSTAELRCNGGRT